MSHLSTRAYIELSARFLLPVADPVIKKPAGIGSASYTDIAEPYTVVVNTDQVIVDPFCSCIIDLLQPDRLDYNDGFCPETSEFYITLFVNIHRLYDCWLYTVCFFVEYH